MEAPFTRSRTEGAERIMWFWGCEGAPQGYHVPEILADWPCTHSQSEAAWSPPAGSSNHATDSKFLPSFLPSFLPALLTAILLLSWWAPPAMGQAPGDPCTTFGSWDVQFAHDINSPQGAWSNDPPSNGPLAKFNAIHLTVITKGLWRGWILV